MHTLDYVVLVGYFVAMIAIGLYCARLTKKQEDFFMGGRSFGKLLQTFAAFGAGTGANDPITTGRTVWTSGLSGIWSVLIWLFVTPFYWIFGVWYRRMRHLTLGDWFVERYQSRAMGAAYTIFGFSFCILYLSSMFSAISKVAVALVGRETIVNTFHLASADDIRYLLLPTIAVVVLIYGAIGGLTAAYWTDLIQGLCIIFLSVMLIPTGLWELVKEHGDPSTMGLMDGFRIMHERTPADFFKMFTGPRSGEFPIHYIISLSLLGLLGIVVQPHFIATGGGSAKTELNARVGLVTGNFLKRFCTVGWALTGLIVLALLADDAIANRDPDYAWGAATVRVLGPLNIGLVGLMLACLLAALMSSADCYMLITSALLVRNIYAAYFNPNASEKTYVMLGRMASVLVIAGAAVASLVMYNVFAQYKLALEVTILFAAPFWLGMYWRRANAWSAWATIAFSALVFFIIPFLAPMVAPGLRTNAAFTISNQIETHIITRSATASDVDKHRGWQEAHERAMSIEDETARQQALTELGAAPPEATLGQPIEERIEYGGAAIFWTDGLQPVGEVKTEEISRRQKGDATIIVAKKVGKFVGQGRFNLDFILYQFVGVDLTTKTRAMLETLRLPPRLITPFLVMMLISLVTPRNDREALDRYYTKMKTP
ncbi:MAG: sodium:solute symporter family protein, partial [Planctomycetales bacterium]|nr:sodium:solute symporter family protein [Planctomycetales bacterium]